MMRATISKDIPVDPATFVRLPKPSGLIGHGSGLWSGNRGGDVSPVADKVAAGVVAVAHTSAAYAALKEDGSVVSWGLDNFGGGSDMEAVADLLQADVAHIAATKYAFAALRADGSVVTWGDAYRGGSPTWAGKTDADVGHGLSEWFGVTKDGLRASVADELKSGVVAIASTAAAFAALKEDGSVVSWGVCYNGADGQSYVWGKYDGIERLTDVVSIASNLDCFAAVRSDGTVVTWGYVATGGDQTNLSYGEVEDVVTVVGGNTGFVALKHNGEIAQWGGIAYGPPPVMTDYVAIVANAESYAGLRSDGSVVSWGMPVPHFMVGQSEADLATGIVSIVATSTAFAAVKSDGTVISWGGVNAVHPDIYQPVGSLVGVRTIVANAYCFAAITEDGVALTWGNPYFGGVRSADDVVEIVPAPFAFAVRKGSGDIIMWGPEGDVPITGGEAVTANDFSFIVAV